MQPRQSAVSVSAAVRLVQACVCFLDFLTVDLTCKRRGESTSSSVCLEVKLCVTFPPPWCVILHFQSRWIDPLPHLTARLICPPVFFFSFSHFLCPVISDGLRQPLPLLALLLCAFMQPNFKQIWQEGAGLCNRGRGGGCRSPRLPLRKRDS